MAMTAEEPIESLTKQLKQALEQLQETTEELRKANARIAELEKQKTPPPSFVKANTKKQPVAEKKARKKREAQFNRARTTGGTGLGLAIVEQLVHAHGGHVSVESQPGKGSCFAFTLPVTLA